MGQEAQGVVLKLPWIQTTSTTCCSLGTPTWAKHRSCTVCKPIPLTPTSLPQWVGLLQPFSKHSLGSPLQFPFLHLTSCWRPPHACYSSCQACCTTCPQGPTRTTNSPRLDAHGQEMLLLLVLPRAPVTVAQCFPLCFAFQLRSLFTSLVLFIMR